MHGGNWETDSVDNPIVNVHAEQYEHYVLDQHSRSVAKWFAFVFRLNWFDTCNLTDYNK